MVTADASALAINVGESLTTEVTASLKDDTLLEMGAKDLKVEFSSNKPEVASVDATGKVTGKAAGHGDHHREGFLQERRSQRNQLPGGCENDRESDRADRERQQSG